MILRELIVNNVCLIDQIRFFFISWFVTTWSYTRIFVYVTFHLDRSRHDCNSAFVNRRYLFSYILHGIINVVICNVVCRLYIREINVLFPDPSLESVFPRVRRTRGFSKDFNLIRVENGATCGCF